MEVKFLEDGVMAVMGPSEEGMNLADEDPRGYWLEQCSTPGGMLYHYTFPCGCVYVFRQEGHWMYCAVALGETDDWYCQSFNPMDGQAARAFDRRKSAYIVSVKSERIDLGEYNPLGEMTSPPRQVRCRVVRKQKGENLIERIIVLNQIPQSEAHECLSCGRSSSPIFNVFYCADRADEEVEICAGCAF